MMNRALKTRSAWAGVILITGVSFFLMWDSSTKEAAIMDELAHIPAGYGYIKYFDARLNPEHPPLVKIIAAIPLLFQDLKFPVSKPSWKTEVNGQWDAGRQFLYESGNDADRIVKWARLGPILLTLLLVLFIYLWSRELLGPWWGLLPALLFAFSPVVLAHGHYVTTDIGAALGVFIATYAFVKYFERRTWAGLFLAGIAFGAAQLLKFSAVLLVPFFIFLVAIIFIRRLYYEGFGGFRFILNLGGSLFGIFLIGYLLVFGMYSIVTINYPQHKQVFDTTTILRSFGEGPDPEWNTCKADFSVSLSRRIRCAAEIDIWMAQNSFWRPFGDYLLGVLMVMQRSGGGNTGYFMGEVSSEGSRFYFPTVFALKEPLPSLLLMGLAFVFASWGIIKGARRRKKTRMFMDYIGTHLAEFSMIAFIGFYWAWSIKSPLNIGVRHLMPTLPFLYILTISQVKKWATRKEIAGGNPFHFLFSLANQFVRVSAISLFVICLTIWFLLETFFTAPHYISYFNQLGGGTDKGYKYVTDSNYDWGQDLKYLVHWIRIRNTNNNNNDDIGKIAINYFGGGNPEYYLGNKQVGWESSLGNPKDKGISWFAISINNLQNSTGKLRSGQTRKTEDEYRWLTKPYEPYARAGKSIFIYKL